MCLRSKKSLCLKKGWLTHMHIPYIHIALCSSYLSNTQKDTSLNLSDFFAGTDWLDTSFVPLPRFGPL